MQRSAITNTDLSCTSRPLRPFQSGDVSMTQADVAAFGSTPLQPIGVDSYVQFKSRQQKGQQPITSTLPFSVDAHNRYDKCIHCIVLCVTMLCGALHVLVHITILRSRSHMCCLIMPNCMWT
jgi:hypothetical protein